MDFQPYMLIIPIFWLCVLYFLFEEYTKAKRSESKADKLYTYAALFALGIGVFIRTFYLTYPYGVHLDEAMAGYDSWCLANYGIDQHLSSYPVYLKSWGSGQSAVYAYLGIPFVKLFGLSTGVFRIPMALVSSLAIIAFYWSLRKTQNNSLLLCIITFIVAINPWHVMMSRWGLDCNIAPNFLLIALSFIVLGCYAISNRKQLIYFALAALFIVATAYSYGISLFVLPLFVILLAIYLIKKKYISYQQLGICAIVMLLIGLPLILFVVQLISGGEQYQLGGITITQLKASRMDQTTIFGTYDPFRIFLAHIIWGVQVIIFGSEGGRAQALPFFGQYYNIVGNIFILISFYFLILKKKRIILDDLMIVWLIATIPILLFVEPNTNHWNLLWFPLIYFSARGIYFCVIRSKIVGKLIYTLFICLFAAFMFQYIKPFANKHEQEEGEFIAFIGAQNFDRVYYHNRPLHPIYLFYSPINPYLYDKTKVVENPEFPLEVMTSYANNYFSLPPKIEPLPNTAFMIPNGMLSEYEIDYTKFHITRGKKYTLLWTK